MKPITPSAISSFRKKIYGYYNTHGRDLPWRKKLNPYRVLVSEIMLQQTQVERVLEKYKEFLVAFPQTNRVRSFNLTFSPSYDTVTA